MSTGDNGNGCDVERRFAGTARRTFGEDPDKTNLTTQIDIEILRALHLITDETKKVKIYNYVLAMLKHTDDSKTSN